MEDSDERKGKVKFMLVFAREVKWNLRWFGASPPFLAQLTSPLAKCLDPSVFSSMLLYKCPNTNRCGLVFFF